MTLSIECYIVEKVFILKGQKAQRIFSLSDWSSSYMPDDTEDIFHCISLSRVEAWLIIIVVFTSQYW